MLALQSYLYFNGDCEKAFEFYRSVFGGEFIVMNRFSEMPENPDFVIADHEKNKIMHITLPISGGHVLMGCDNLSVPVIGSNYAISINTDNQDEAVRLFDGLSDQGQVTMAMNKTFWGSYFGMFTDQFGIHWMVNCDLNGHD